MLEIAKKKKVIKILKISYFKLLRSSIFQFIFCCLLHKFSKRQLSEHEFY